jgi:hypothetical protein
MSCASCLNGRIRIRLTGDLHSCIAEEAAPEGYLTMYQLRAAGSAFPG